MNAVGRHDDVLRLARLVLLLAALKDAHPDGVDWERLGIYDFLVAYPLLLTRDDDDPDRATLLLAGFDDRALVYASPAQQFATAQLHLPHDLAHLLGCGLLDCAAAGRIRYSSTAAGDALATQFTSMKAVSYRASTGIVVRRLRRLSERTLRGNLRTWLQ